jgi:spore maturation protein A
MKIIGAFFRWLLTMNAVWGLMIVTAFSLTVYRQYAPKVVLTPNDVWHEGPNRVAITLKSGEKAEEILCSVVRKGNDFVVETSGSVGGRVQKEAPKASLLKVEPRRGDTFAMIWQTQEAGEFAVVINGKAVGKGKLVNLQALTDAALEYAKKAFELGLGLVSTMVLFLGLMKVGEDAGLVKFVARLMRPIITWLFPEIPPEHPAVGAIIMNFTTSVLGLGNAATPFGLKAMNELQTLNKHKTVATNPMVVLLGWNTAGFAIIPTSMLAVRKAAGCSDVMQIIGPCMVGGLCSTIAAITLAKLLGKLKMFSVEAALAEEAEEMKQLGQPEAKGEDASPSSPSGDDGSGSDKDEGKE